MANLNHEETTITSETQRSSWKKARDIHTIAWLDQKLPDAQRTQGTSNRYQQCKEIVYSIGRSYPNHLLGVIESIITFFNAQITSNERLQEHRQWLSESETTLPETHEEWNEQFVKELVNREQHIAPNLALTPPMYEPSQSTYLTTESIAEACTSPNQARAGCPRYAH